MPNIQQPTLLIIAGPNGAGKTTFSQKFISLDKFKRENYVNADDIANGMQGGWHNPDNFYPAAIEADRIREDRLQKRQDIAFETVYSSPGKLDFLKKAKSQGYFVSLVYLCAETPEIHAARVCRRVMENGHDVPISKIIKRYARSIYFAAKSVEYLDAGYFLDSTLPNEKPKMIGKILQGNAYFSGNPPAWSKPIENRCRILLKTGVLEDSETGEMVTHQSDVIFAGPIPKSEESEDDHLLNHTGEGSMRTE